VEQLDSGVLDEAASEFDEFRASATQTRRLEAGTEDLRRIIADLAQYRR
jgi:hypothetical protein